MRRLPRIRSFLQLLLSAALLCVLLPLVAPAAAAALDSRFVTTSIGGLSAPTAMALAPDGRIFVTEQGGAVRVVKNGAVLATPFVTVSVDSTGERGLLGVALDPAFVSNGFVYVYYTTSASPVHNRVSRFTASGDTAVPGSEVQLLNLNNLSTATNHNGGPIHFGPDGKLYIGVGENAQPNLAQRIDQPFGKILRVNSDGSVPADNPFFDGNGPNYDAIWAYGLRNPFTIAFQPGTGRLFADDVGQSTWEEIDEIVKGGNYGWPTREGPCAQGSTTNCGPPPAGMINPLYAYTHAEGCAIVGGAFYNPPPAAPEPFPSDFVGDYFFADLCSGFVRTLQSPGYTSAAGFLDPDASLSPVAIEVSPDGSLWYLSRGHNALFHLRFEPPFWHAPFRARTDGVLASGPAATAVRGFIRVDSFVRGTDSAVYWTSYQGAGFSSWIWLGAPPGGVVGDPAAASWAPGRLDVFARGTNNKLWQRFSTNGGATWSSWFMPVPDGTLASSPATATWAPNRLDVMVTGTDGQVYQRFWDTTTWSSAWLARGRPPSGPVQGTPSSTSWAPGRLDVFARGTDNRLWQTFWNGQAWSAWIQPPGTASGVLASAPSAASWGLGHLAVFTRGTDGGLYTTAFEGFTFSDWSRLGTATDVIVGPPGATSRGQGALDAFARGTDDKLYLYIFSR
jgi:glucose/arabinose dehydrogenase